MASVSETTAVALRKGTTEENLLFTGVLAELTADLGYPDGGQLGVDSHVTVRLHNGVTAGGIPMARADMKNISTQVLAQNRIFLGDKNLAYADLTNMEETDDPAARNNIVDILNTYGLATKVNLEEVRVTLANRDMSNVDTSTLAGGRGDQENGNLAYTDTSNLNTKFLVNKNIHKGVDGDKPLAYSDLANIDTLNATKALDVRPASMTGPVLADNELENVSNATLSSIFFDAQRDFLLETIKNKDNDIAEVPEANHYPTTGAIKEYIDTFVTDIYTKASTQLIDTFTGTNTPNQVLTLNRKLNFILYVGGVLQPSHCYQYNADTNQITIPWPVEDTTNENIVVVYQGFKR